MAAAEKPTACPFGSLGNYQYAVILSRFQGSYLLSRKKGRDTWEMQGGHIEPGETPLIAAERELYEETGTVSFTLKPLCDYRGEEPGRDNYGSGAVFEAEISELGELPDFEMEEIRLFEKFPSKLTYPLITGTILNYRDNMGVPLK